MDNNIFIYHYFEKERGPFMSLSDLPDDEVQKLINKCRAENAADGKHSVIGNVYSDDNIFKRRIQETMSRETFSEKGGKPVRQFPYYAILALGNDPTYEEGLKSWYRNGDSVKIPIEELDINTISFTYGDQCQTVNPDWFDKFKLGEYRPPIYTFSEIFKVIEERGWISIAQRDWSDPWYIEANIWSDLQIDKYRKLYQRHN